MKHVSSSRSSRLENERGIAVFIFIIGMVMLAIGGGFALDVGFTQFQQRRIQIASDAAAFAAAELLGPTVYDSDVYNEASYIGGANGLQNGEALIECGKWDSATKTFSACNDDKKATPVCASCGDVNTNAVRVRSARQVATRFAMLLGINQFAPNVKAVAVNNNTLNLHCLRPFGIEQDILDDPDNPIEIEEQFTITYPAPGNWGKLDLGGINMSSGTNFGNYMLSGFCDGSVSVGDDVSAGTGFGGPLTTPFEPLLDKEIIISATAGFPNGNSSPVNLTEFIKVRFDAQIEKGGNWTGYFTLVERNVDLDDQVVFIKDMIKLAQ